MADDQCCVCFDTVSKKNSVICPFCPVKTLVCKPCTKTYLLESVQFAHCMNPNCKHEWSLEFLCKAMTKKWVHGEYTKNRKEKDLEKEMGLMAETMPAAEREIKRVNFIKKRNESLKISAEKRRQARQLFKNRKVVINSIDSFYKHIDSTLSDSKSELKDLENQKKEIYKQEKEIRQEIKELRQKYRLLVSEYLDQENIEDMEKIKKPMYMFACSLPVCTGLIKQETWTCSICDTLFCSRCHLEKLEKHKCKKEDKENAKEIMNSTKSCPKCFARIFKITGCDQMFCTMCNTPFSWNKGTIETGIVHNPHYFEYMRKVNNGVVPRQPGDIPGLPQNVPNCQQLLPILDLYEKVRHTSEEEHRYHQCDLLYQGICKNHILCKLYSIYHILGRTQYIHVDQGEFDGQRLRISYLCKEISLEKLKQLLFLRKRRFERKKEVFDILQTFRVLTIERVNTLARTDEKDITEDSLLVLYKEVEDIILFCNKSLEKFFSLSNTCCIFELNLERYVNFHIFY
jgi:hypothetical protein